MMTVSRRAIARLQSCARAFYRWVGRRWTDLDRGWKATALSVTLLVAISYAPL
jgi:hypothetical protein